MDRTVHNGLRWSAARAYLDPAKAPQEPDDLDRMPSPSGSSSKDGGPSA